MQATIVASNWSVVRTCMILPPPRHKFAICRCRSSFLCFLYIFFRQVYHCELGTVLRIYAAAELCSHSVHVTIFYSLACVGRFRCSNSVIIYLDLFLVLSLHAACIHQQKLLTRATQIVWSGIAPNNIPTSVTIFVGAKAIHSGGDGTDETE